MDSLYRLVDDKRVRYLLNECGILDEERIVYHLERYKFMERGKLQDLLLSIHPDKPVTWVDGDFESVEGIPNILMRVTGDRADLVMNVFHPVNIDALKISLYQYKVNVVWVTPYRYELLKGSESEVNYLLVFGRLMLECIKFDASDLHVSVGHKNQKPFYPIYYRVSGEYRELSVFTFSSIDNTRLVEYLVGGKTSALSIDLGCKEGITSNINDFFGDGNTEVRICANKVSGGFDCVCRIQQKKTFRLGIEDLGFDADTQSVLNRVVQKTSGITLITGAIRTGKNTTACAIANEMCKRPIKIKSIDSPIELLMPFPQIDYLADEERLLAAVRLIKKQDVNVVIVNEIPTSGVAAAVKDLAISSVHVITTMHLDRIWYLPYRLQEYYGENYKSVISQINCVINQKMFRILDREKCFEILTSDTSQVHSIEILKKEEVTKVYVPRDDDSYKGIQPIAEYLWLTDEIKTKLLHCEYAWEMEQIIHDEVVKNKSSLEDKMVDAIRDGRLLFSELENI